MEKLKGSFSTIEYTRSIYEDWKPELPCAARNKRDFEGWKRRFRARLRRILGDFPEKKCPLSPRKIFSLDRGDYTLEKIIYYSEPEVPVPAYVLIPKGKEGPFRTIVAQHGHGNGKGDVVGWYTNDLDGPKKTIEYYNTDYAHQFARRGYLVIAPDARGFGERKETGDPGLNQCYRLSLNLLLYGKTAVGVKVWDVIRTLDYLETRKDVDKNHIGMAGLSMGGTITLFTAALEDRIKAAIISGFLCTFKRSIIDVHHCLCSYVPGVLKLGEMHDVACCIAPRPLLVESGFHDDWFPIDGCIEAANNVKKIYKTLGISDRFYHDVFESHHRWNGKYAYEWMDRWL